MQYLLTKLKWLTSLSGLSLRTLLLLLVFTSMVGCSGTGALKFLTGGGPNVAANVQAGKTNTQTIGQTKNFAPTVSVRPKARVDNIDQSSDTTNNYQLPAWVWVLGGLLFIIGWVTDTPATYITNFRRRKKDG